MACLGSSRTNIHVALRAVCMGILCQIQIFFPIEFYFGFYNHVNLRLLPPMTVWRKDSFSGRGWHVAAHVQWIPRLGGAQTLPIRLFHYPGPHTEHTTRFRVLAAIVRLLYGKERIIAGKRDGGCASPFASCDAKLGICSE